MIVPGLIAIPLILTPLPPPEKPVIQPPSFYLWRGICPRRCLLGREKLFKQLHPGVSPLV